MAAAYPPQYAIFAKDTEAQKMIIVALNDDVFATLYRARGVLAQLTAQARTTQFFQDVRAEGVLTFPICKILGFTRLIVSDGKDFIHLILIQ